MSYTYFMKKSLSQAKQTTPSLKVQETQTVAIIVLGVALIVMACIVAVLLAQVDGHRRSIESLFQITTNLPTSEQ